MVIGSGNAGGTDLPAKAGTAEPSKINADIKNRFIVADLLGSARQVKQLPRQNQKPQENRLLSV